jgi:Tfp pilus assembly protein PilV
MVVALAILAIGIVSVLHAFSSSLTATRQAEDYTTAAILADQVASNLDSQSSITAGQLTGAFDDEPKYSWEADVEDADANGLMRTTITIAWSAGNNPRQYILVTDLLPSMSVQTVGTGGP